MNGAQFSNDLYAVFISKRWMDIPDEILEKGTRLTTTQPVLHLPIVFLAFLERMAGKRFIDIIEEAIIQQTLESDLGKRTFARFCENYFARQVKEITHERTV